MHFGFDGQQSSSPSKWEAILMLRLKAAVSQSVLLTPGTPVEKLLCLQMAKSLEPNDAHVQWGMWVKVPE